MKKAQNHYKNYQNRQPHRIHVAYNFKNSDGSYGFGRKNMTVSRKATQEQIENYIKEIVDCDSLVVLSWQPLKEY